MSLNHRSRADLLHDKGTSVPQSFFEAICFAFTCDKFIYVLLNDDKLLFFK